MTTREINQYYHQVSKELNENLIASALMTLKALMDKLGDFRFREELLEINKTYSLMLQYFVEGLPDPKRDEITENLTLRLHCLNDRLNYQALSVAKDSDYFTAVRSESLKSISLKELLKQFDDAINKIYISVTAEKYSQKLHADYQEILYKIFNKIWTTQFLDKDSIEIISSRLCNNPMESEDYRENTVLQSLILGALYLGTMEYYDSAKIKLIITTILNNDDVNLLARAYVLLVITLNRYRERISKEKSLISLLRLATDKDDLPAIYRSLIDSFIKSQDTARINRTIREEIMPDLIKMRPEIEQAFRNMEENFDSEESDYNPQWEEILKNSSLEEKMRELSDLQMEGADMFMMAFAGIKRVPFFRNPANWFIPFYPNHTEIKESVDRFPLEFMEMVSISSIFCDSDCYSLFLGLKMMPEENIKMMTNQIQAQVNQFEEDRMASLEKISQHNISTLINRFIKDLYRFYNQFVNAKDFYNPFASEIDFTSIPVFGKMIDNLDTLSEIGNLYFRKEMWKESVVVFTECTKFFEENLLLAKNIPSRDFYLNYEYIDLDNLSDAQLATILGKKGYALMRLRRYDEAIDSLLLSQLFQSPSSWVYSHVADCFRHLGDEESYLRFLDRAIELDSDNNRLLLKRSALFIGNGEYDEAVKLLYKLNYFDSENLHYIRTLAWCRCLQGEFEKALEFYLRIPAEKKDKYDLINMGHCYFATGNYNESFECYNQYVKLTSVAEFIRSLNSDSESIEYLKTHLPELGLLRDAVILVSEQG